MLFCTSVYKSCLVKGSKIENYSEIEAYLQASHKLTHISLLKPPQAHGPLLCIKQFVLAHVPSGIPALSNKPAKLYHQNYESQALKSPVLISMPHEQRHSFV